MTIRICDWSNYSSSLDAIRSWYLFLCIPQGRRTPSFFRARRRVFSPRPSAEAAAITDGNHIAGVLGLRRSVTHSSTAFALLSEIFCRVSLDIGGRARATARIASRRSWDMVLPRLSFRTNSRRSSEYTSRICSRVASECFCPKKGLPSPRFAMDCWIRSHSRYGINLLSSSRVIHGKNAAKLNSWIYKYSCWAI